MWAAIRTIIIADAVMGLDNVIAVAGAAHGNFLLVIIGLLVSVPIVVWGSTLFIKWIEKYPSIIYIGAGVLALTAGKMITGEKFLAPLFRIKSAWQMVVYWFTHRSCAWQQANGRKWLATRLKSGTAVR